MFITNFDLNLPLDEFVAVDMDFIENMTGIRCNSCPCLYLIELSFDMIVRQYFFCTTRCTGSREQEPERDVRRIEEASVSSVVG
jgi:hypothetical protein